VSITDDMEVLSLIHRRGLFGCLRLAHCHKGQKSALSTLAKVCLLATCR
jgi:hypothetical protein